MRFKLPPDFLKFYKNKPVNFGFGGLGEFVYYRSYSRDNENWLDTTQRVIEGMFEMQREHIIVNNQYWDNPKAIEMAKKMFDKVFKMKFIPSGRMLFSMGTPIIYDAKKYAVLSSCSFVSTENMSSKPFAFLMDMSFLGVGVGFDTKGKDKIKIIKPNSSVIKTRIIPDTREGWVQSLTELLDSYFLGLNEVHFDYSQIRERGEPLKMFGGTASGYECLENMHRELKRIFDKNVGKKVSSRMIVDINNLSAKAAISGNIRRAALIALGEYEDEEFYDLKNYEKYPDRASHGWASNNSVIVERGDDYSEIVKRINNNGEPGLFWLEHAQEYSRMNGDKDFIDLRAMGCNPCVEQTLESYEMCCLVDTFPNKHESLEEYLDTLKYAFMYSKTVALGESHWDETNEVLRRNRRMGISMSGIAQFINDRGLNELKIWCNTGYDYLQKCDESLSEWLNVNRSIKLTSIKPSGTLSLLAGATPGIHPPEGKCYIRRVRILKDSKLIKPLKEAGYKVEIDKDSNENVVADFPIKIEGDIRTSKEMSMWEKLEWAAFMQEHWCDNQVSCTVTFDKDTEGEDLLQALNIYQYKLKGISFLPYTNNMEGAQPFPQMPYEEITEEEYYERSKNLKKIKFDKKNDAEEEEKFCSNDQCL